MAVGNDGYFTMWKLDTLAQELNLQIKEIPVPENLKSLNFLSVEFTNPLPAPVGTYCVVIGADDGSLVVFDQEREVFVDLGTRG